MGGFQNILKTQNEHKFLNVFKDRKLLCKRFHQQQPNVKEVV